MTMTAAVENFKSHDGKDIVVTGTVKKVCEKKGCWMQVEDGTTKVRTMFKDYGFFVPKEILNKKVKLAGKIMKKEVSVSMQRHLLKDEGASKDKIAKVTEPKMTFRFEATGVEVL